MGKTLSNKYGQKLLDSTKQSTTDAIKTASKREIQKGAEATGGLIGNKIADKITSFSKRKSTQELNNNDEAEEDKEITTHKKRYISQEERQQIIDELRLVPKTNVQVKVNIKNIYISPKKRQQIINKLMLVQ